MCHSLRGAALCLAAILLLAPSAFGASTKEDFEGWNLEPGVGQAHLVMVARVTSVGKLTVVEGAKTNVALREYHFQPIRLLKGIFQRDQLSMTASDLGAPEEDATTSPPIKEGEFRLLILAQRQGSLPGQLRSMGCVAATPGATTFEERVPLLTGPDDPLVGVIETLIRVADSRSRRERATLLIDRLVDIKGVAAVPLLTSLRSRADWAATDSRAIPALAYLAQSNELAVRGAATDALRDTLANRIMPEDPSQLDDVARALRGTLTGISKANDPKLEAKTSIRLAAYAALGRLLALKSDFDWPRDWLIAQISAAATRAERDAAVNALSRIERQPQVAAALVDALAKLPLDEQPGREYHYAHAALRVDPAGAERVLLDRLKQSLAARQSLASEIELLARVRSKELMPFLLTAADQRYASANDGYPIAQALGKLGGDQGVPVLIRWLRGSDSNFKEIASWALEEIDSQQVVQEVRPLLKTESSLPLKLRIARMLARHEINDGYALATEHLADDDHTATAALVLTFLKDPRAAKDLSAIIASRPDRRWHAAALTGLVSIGDEAARKQLLDILADDRHPLVVDAIVAVGLTDDPALVAPLATLARSRNKQIASVSLVALKRYLSGVRASKHGLAAVELVAAEMDESPLLPREIAAAPLPAAKLPEETRAALNETVAALASDAYIDADVRLEALVVARLLAGEHLAELLTKLTDQAELEGSPILGEAQKALRRSREVVKQQ